MARWASSLLPGAAQVLAGPQEWSGSKHKTFGNPCAKCTRSLASLHPDVPRKHLAMPSDAASRQHNHHELWRLFNTTMPLPPPPPGARPVAVFVRRTNGRVISASDEAAIRVAVEATGFEFRVFTGKGGLASAIALFRTARAVIGYHGAGLVNAMLSVSSFPTCLVEVRATQTIIIKFTLRSLAPRASIRIRRSCS